MLRQSLIPLAISVAMCLTPTAWAQRNSAPVIKGVTTGEVAATLDELRASNAELRVRVTGIESEKADLNGKVETLEFLLSQSRDEINRLQTDDAALDSLVTKLEQRLRDQDARIKQLEARLNAALEMSADAALSGDLSNADPEADFTELDARPELSGASDAAAETSGPTRIVRRTVTTASNTATNTGTTTQTTTRSVQSPQPGTLGTISATALPGEAGPLFAEAKSRLLQFDYAGAEAAFRSFLDQFGDDPQAGEAQYWLAEVLYQQEAYAESGAAYTTMIRSYPDDPRAPEALAKLARSMRLVGDTEKACGALDLLPQQYPNASGVTKNLAAGERVRSGCDS